MDGYIPRRFDLCSSFVGLMNAMSKTSKIVSASFDLSGKYGSHIDIKAQRGDELIEIRELVSKIEEEQA